jgi:hypothetical protein
MATTMLLDFKDSVMAMLPDVPLTDAVIFGIHIHGACVHFLFSFVLSLELQWFCSEVFP